MPPDPLPNYIATFRKRSGLSQEELAALLGSDDGSVVSRYEGHSRTPKLEAILACEIILGTPVREIFAGIFETVERLTKQRARGLLACLEDVSSDPVVQQKLETLRRISGAANGNSAGGDA